ncbi:S-methyl-5-thioribose-1-phosphate isomerase [Rhizobium ruizarguesonis]|jgi:methylthioribose-1-phosphate isomerase|uniref:S-methyl-5-thioribose-1-phosphate isomerase n=1 Tax=Rhizobium ruizarguesonis TaxID=2081791 RepID=UPI0013DFEF22|nr:S-methyl-5-thioribose-1-phosphate isomerase [Rhizobium ruizarguesonis]NEI79077.1 S-methyl-5-thioribose-1-phosphate isomerase [Rhizobium ruizarguesonis]
MTAVSNIPNAFPVPLRWDGEALDIIDQRALPQAERRLRLNTCADVASAIRTLAIRGAPLLGIAAAYGLVLAAREGKLSQGGALLRAARPTAVNLPRTLDRCIAVVTASTESPEATLLAEAQRLVDIEADASDGITQHGALLLAGARTIMTVCNTGALGTGHRGTALGIIIRLAETGPIAAICCETRPLLQGTRLTSWELSRHGVTATVIVDGAAAALMRTGPIDAVIVGCDRLAANGDLVNKIGTYGVALAAAAHGIPFIVAATRSSIDAATPSGDDVEIEQRDPSEILDLVPGAAALPGVTAFNPAFDVTPARLITAVVTEAGVIRHASDPRNERLADTADRAAS